MARPRLGEKERRMRHGGRAGDGSRGGGRPRFDTASSTRSGCSCGSCERLLRPPPPNTSAGCGRFVVSGGRGRIRPRLIDRCGGHPRDLWNRKAR